MTKVIKIPLPVNIDTKSLPLFKPYTEYKIDPLCIKKLKNVFVTYSGLAVNKKGLVKESHHDYSDMYDLWLDEVSRSGRDVNDHPDNLIELDDDNTYLLIHHPWYNYYHWICESILRLWMVKARNKMILLLPDFYQKSDFIMGSLEPFKLQKIYFIPEGKSVFVKNLCLPQIKPICDSYHVDELKEIRHYYLNYVNSIKKININLGEKIYLSRKKAARKKVVNESEVEEILGKYDFNTVYNEDYSFLEQVSIYSNAKYLVSIHGSGLTNMLFMKEGSYILELHKRVTNTLDHPSFVFWYQAAVLEFQYYHQLCEPISEIDNYFTGDFNVNIEMLKKNLAAIFLKAG
jgi:capsular polysaccharide biosynthesis protein